MRIEIPIVTKEQAIKLKEIGFDEQCGSMWGEYDGYEGLHQRIDNNNRYNGDKLFSAPTMSFALAWLRKVKEMHISAHPSYNADGIIYMCTVFFIEKETVNNILLKDEPLTVDYTPPQIFNNYDDANSAGLNYILDYLTKKTRIE